MTETISSFHVLLLLSENTKKQKLEAFLRNIYYCLYLVSSRQQEQMYREISWEFKMNTHALYSNNYESYLVLHTTCIPNKLVLKNGITVVCMQQNSYVFAMCFI